jgi:hypothetical protein
MCRRHKMLVEKLQVINIPSRTGRNNTIDNPDFLPILGPYGTNNNFIIN